MFGTSPLSREDFAQHHFERRGETLLYVPLGTTMGSTTYVVADEAARERIEAAHRPWGIRVAVFNLSWAVSGAATGLWVVHDLGYDSFFKPSPLAAAIFLLATLFLIAAPFLAAHLAMRKLRDLPRGPKRTLRDQTLAAEPMVGRSWALWATILAGLVLLGLGIEEGIRHYGAGNLVRAGFFSMLFSITGLMMAAQAWYLLRTRKLRAENVRLEAVVEERTRELKELNETLERRVQEQVQHIEKLGQLKHFFAAPVAEMILNDKGFDPARVHRRELTAISLDLRGFTAFSETSEPEEVISVLRIYHAELGIQVNRCQATLEHFAGDGVMLFLNDPVEVKDHPLRALDLAVALREAMQPHLREWRANGFDLGLGIGIATGYATIGAVGYEGRWEYAAIGTVCNLAARLCSEAKDGQIVVSKRFLSRLGDRAVVDELGERPLKGLSRPVAMYNVKALRSPEAAPA